MSSTYFGYFMRSEELKQIVAAGNINGKRDRQHQQEKILDNFYLWHTEISK